MTGSISVTTGPGKDGAPAPVTLAETAYPLTTAEQFFARLTPQDAAAVRRVIEVVENLADRFHNDEFTVGSAYFAVYAIGGNVTKLGKRPDIDLLVAEGAYFRGLYSPSDKSLAWAMTRSEKKQMEFRRIHEGYNNDWVASALQEEFEIEGYQAQLVEEMPNGYDFGASPKGLLRLTPAVEDSGKSPIDIVIVKTAPNFMKDSPATLEEFETVTDVDTHGNPLPKVLLLRR